MAAMAHGHALPPSANALHYPAYVKYLTALLCHSFAAQIMIVAIGWQVYDITRNPWDLGLIGLSQFLPALCWCW